MKLADYLNQLEAALRADERVTEVAMSANNLPYDTVRVLVSYGNAKRATCFVSAERVESCESLEEGEDLERFMKVMAV